MRAVVQRVSQASVLISGELRSSIGQGLLILVGFHHQDQLNDIDILCQKIIKLRIFSDAEGKMNKSVKDIGGDILVVSQFTLYANTEKGNRPSFTDAARPEIAIPLYESFIKTLSVLHQDEIKTGVFGADMKINLVNDGPVTIWFDSML